MKYKKVLVIGGTKQMGLHLIEELLRKDYDVTVANRGKTGDHFGNKIKRIVFNRYDEESVKQAFQDENAKFDAIIDTIAFNGSSVDMMFKYVETKKYIQFSSISVYTMLNVKQHEEDFKPFEFEPNQFNDCLQYLTAGDAKYQLGKKAAEKAAVRYSADSVIIRIPSVAGKDALNPMLRQYVEAIMQGKEICLERCKFERKFAITETCEPGRFAVFALEHDLSGIYNVASNGYVTNEMIVRYIENRANKKANIVWGEKNNCFHVDFPEHTLDTRKAQKCGFKFSNVEDWLLGVLDYFISSYKISNDAVSMNKSNSMLTSMGEIVYRFLEATKYGGDLFEYLDDCGISEFDLYVEEEAISFLPVLFNLGRRMPNNIYANVKEIMEIKLELSGKNKTIVRPLSQAQKCEKKKVIITFCHWNYPIYRRIELLNYQLISLVSVADYSLYKNVILGKCKNYLRQKGIKYLFTKFPQANRVKNQSPLEKYLSDKGIYGLNSNCMEYGLNIDEVYTDTIATSKLVNGVYQLVDTSTKHLNIINGFRVTTDIPSNTNKRIWLFGSSVVFGRFTDDEHTIASSLQRELNNYFGEENDWAVVNASNYSANNVGVVFPFLESLPLEKGDICIFNMEFPTNLLEKYDEIIDLSKYFDRPHNYGEVFADINHMVGRGYCAQGKVLFELLRDTGGYFETSEGSIGGECEEKVPSYNSNLLSEQENVELSKYLKGIANYKRKIGSIVMNCNPFTYGHRYLIEESAKKVDELFIFVVEEDKSYFSFKDRLELVKRGTEDLKNVVVLPSGQFIISQRTFEAYSNKAALQDTKIDASLDVEIFGRNIAPALGITVRFAGEEPLDKVTKQYNDTMRRILPKYGIHFEIIPRKEYKGEVISASRVRQLLNNNNFDEIAKIVPKTTFDYLKERFGK